MKKCIYLIFSILALFFISCGGMNKNVELFPNIRLLDEVKTQDFTLKNLEGTKVRNGEIIYEVGYSYVNKPVFFPKENIVLYQGQHQYSVFDAEGRLLYKNELPEEEKFSESVLTTSRLGYFLESSEYNEEKKQRDSFFYDVRDPEFKKHYIIEINDRAKYITDKRIFHYVKGLNKEKDTLSYDDISNTYDELYQKAEIVYNLDGYTLFLVDKQWVSLTFYDFQTHYKTDENGKYLYEVWHRDRKRGQPLIDKNTEIDAITFVKSTENPAIGTIEITDFKITEIDRPEIFLFDMIIPTTYYNSEHRGWANYEIKINNNVWKMSAYNYRYHYTEPLHEFVTLYGMPKGYENCTQLRFLYYTNINYEKEESSFIIVPN